MHRFLQASLLGLLAAGQAGFAAAADASHPTVIELYESQGCSSCPPANANLNAIADRPDVLALNFAVTYWDRLGWKDTFAQEAFTNRQYDYANARQDDSVYTPQMIVNGSGVLVGNRAEDVNDALLRYDRGNGGPDFGWASDMVTVAQTETAQSAQVWLVRYDPRDLEVAIGRGENSGRTLGHRNIVKELVLLGTVSDTARFALPKASDPGLRTAVLVQEGTGGPILGAARMP